MARESFGLLIHRKTAVSPGSHPSQKRMKIGKVKLTATGDICLLHEVRNKKSRVGKERL